MFAGTCGWLLAAETGGQVLHFTLRPLLDQTGLPLALGGISWYFLQWPWWSFSPPTCRSC